MSNLIPEKRLDRNGKLVTKHVRATPKQAAGSLGLLPPALGAEPSQSSAVKAFKPRKSQTLQEHRSHGVNFSSADDRLISEEDRKLRSKQQGMYTYYTFTASEVEIYDVLSVASNGDAILLLSQGVRTADEARAYLNERGLPDLILDRSNLMQEAIEKNVSYQHFIEGYDSLRDDYLSSEHIIDAIQFLNTSLNAGPNAAVIKEIIAGTISFDDIKEIGITKLKPDLRLYCFQPVLQRMKRGESSPSIEEIRNLLDKMSEDRVDSVGVTYIGRSLEELSVPELMQFKNLANFTNAYRAYRIGSVEERYKNDGVQRAVYAALLQEGTEEANLEARKAYYSNDFYYYSNDFYEAQIPLDIAIDVTNNGGAVEQAIAIHREGISSSVSSGWL